MKNKGCMCQECGDYYTVDLMIPDEVWDMICDGNNLLCGVCIMQGIEDISNFDAWKLEHID